jgi:GTP-binding protein
VSAVVIVGRKNVGKSTIFNRLVGMKMSVVYRDPGVTRDRIFGEVQWMGKSFDIVDTGGFFPDEKHRLANKITRQIERALEEADVIYFVVDGKAGLKPGDEEINGQIRRANKKVFLLINKIDTKKDEMKALEFSRFGFENMFSVSAEAGIGFGDVLDATVKVLPQLKKNRDDKNVLRLLILGRPNSGKSTLLNSIIKEERAIVDEEPGTTRDMVNAQFTLREQRMEIIDTCGIRKRSRIKEPIEFYSMTRAVRLIERADVVILLFDATEGVVEQDRRIASLILAKAKGLLIVPNKIDLIGKNSLHKIVPATRQSFKFLDFVPVIPISAKQSKGIDALMNRVVDIFIESNKVIEQDVLNTIVHNIQPPASGEIIKLAQVGKRPPIFRATLVTRVKDHYIKYLRNTLRNYFGFSGVPILIKTKIVKRR